MNRGLVYFIVAVVAVGVIAGGAFLVSVYYQAGSGEASEPISAPELSLDDESGEAESGETVDAGDDSAGETDDPAGETTDSGEEATEEADEEPAEEMADDGEDTAAMAGDSAGSRVLYRITQDESEVRFELDELLFGDPKHVVGTTDQVAGDFIIDFGNLANSELGPVRINARTLVTDNEFRNRAIRSQILGSSSAEYEFINFTPTALESLPESGGVGDTAEFQVTGDLQIRDVTQPVTFTVTVTVVSEDRVEGTAHAEVLRSDFGLEIPNVPSVADVSDEVQLYIDFVGLRVSE